MRGRQKKPELVLPDLANLIRDSRGDVGSSLGLALGGLEPEKKLEVLERFLRQCPPEFRVAVLGDVVLTPETQTLLQENWAAEQRRPALIQGLVEIGRTQGTIDLAAVPKGTEVMLGLLPRRPNLMSLRPETILRSAQYRNLMSELRFQALGEGIFKTKLSITENLYRDYGQERVHISAKEALRFASEDPFGQPTTTFEYGSNVTLLYQEQACDYRARAERNAGLAIHMLGCVMLDGEPVFSEAM